MNKLMLFYCITTSIMVFMFLMEEYIERKILVKYLIIENNISDLVCYYTDGSIEFNTLEEVEDRMYYIFDQTRVMINGKPDSDLTTRFYCNYSVRLKIAIFNSIIKLDKCKIELEERVYNEDMERGYYQ